MTETTAPLNPAEIDPDLWCLFDQYVHGHIDRRSFLDRATRFAMAAGTTSVALLAALSPDFARAQKVAPSDARLKTEFVEFASPAGYGKVRAYVARPAQAKGPLPEILVVHENRGLNPHIEDIARRLALENFIAVAPDALFPLGGYPGDEDKARDLFGKLDQAKTREDFVAAASYARTISGGSGKLGVIGFCYGGGMANFLAARVPEVLAAAPFYGAPAPADLVGHIKAELVLMFADNDERINAAWPAYETALTAAGVKHTAYKYAGTQHGFNNDTTPRFDASAAAQAWGHALDLFNRTLR
ncbi:MAG TPA: dienelactone hydrolase family protein [Burkholderiaceae bacterium]|jgi:carboxymethylenebutenolidase